MEANAGTNIKENYEEDEINKITESGNALLEENSSCDGIISSVIDKFDGLYKSNIHTDGKKKKQVPMPVPEDADSYKMDHSNRGHAIIFNHKTFVPELAMAGADIRTSTDKDVKALEKCLKDLEFEVKVYNDCTVEQVLNKVKKWSRKDHSKNDCFVLICLTHGASGDKEEVEELLASNSKYRISELWQPFTAERCPSLAGKPKLFFFQACRGNRFDSGVTLNKQVDSVSNSEEASDLQADCCPTYTIPSAADFLFAYSTVPGYYSWREENRGSWFIQSLCHVLSEHGSTMEINEIFLKVKLRVATKYESNTEDIRFDSKKEVPSIDSRLVRKLVFSPKTDNNCNKLSNLKV